jgi:hypothetical protein
MLSPRSWSTTVATIWQRPRDEHGLQASIASFRRYLWATMPDRQALRGQVTVCKPDPGDRPAGLDQIQHLAAKFRRGSRVVPRHSPLAACHP